MTTTATLHTRYIGRAWGGPCSLPPWLDSRYRRRRCLSSLYSLPPSDTYVEVAESSGPSSSSDANAAVINSTHRRLLHPRCSLRRVVSSASSIDSSVVVVLIGRRLRRSWCDDNNDSSSFSYSSSKNSPSRRTCDWKKKIKT